MHQVITSRTRRTVVRKFMVLAALIMGMTGPAEAAVKPHGLFTDNMVLQQGDKVPVWGTADPGETVNVKFEGNGFGQATGLRNPGEITSRFQQGIAR
jgi:hypothetical protein